MSQRTTLVRFGVLLFSLTLSSTLSAQERPVVKEELEEDRVEIELSPGFFYRPDDGSYSTRGPALAIHDVVDRFFDIALKRRQERAWNAFVRELEIPLGSESENKLRSTMFEALVTTTEKLSALPYMGKPKEWDRVQSEWLRGKARRLGELWRGLLNQLDADGIDHDQLYLFLEETVRPSFSQFSAGDNRAFKKILVKEFKGEFIR